MRHAIALGIAVTSLVAGACSHATNDPSAGPPPAAVATADLPAGLPGVKTYRVPIEGLPASGDPRALVTVVAFTDYQCPYCRRAEATLAQLRQAYGSQLRVVVAEKPLPMHDQARGAALAALAASGQGAYDLMRARLYAGPLDERAIATAVGDLGLDARRFEADRSGMAAEALARSEALAERLDVRGTPTLFINGRHVVGAQPLDELRAVVDERLTAARARVAAGVRPEDVYAQTIAGGAERVEEPADDEAPGCGGEGACNGKDGDPPPAVVVERVPTAGAPARGPARASITVVEFADFECPFCARAETTLHALEQAHPGDVRVVFKNLPLPFHDHARPMAKAALAAEAQGHFWEMHDRLFALPGAVDRPALDRVAQELGLDVARFDRDLDGAALEARLDADGADAAALGVKGTPTFFVNGRRVVGAQPAAVFEKALARK